MVPLIKSLKNIAERVVDTVHRTICGTTEMKCSKSSIHLRKCACVPKPCNEKAAEKAHQDNSTEFKTFTHIRQALQKVRLG